MPTPNDKSRPTPQWLTYYKWMMFVEEDFYCCALENSVCCTSLNYWLSLFQYQHCPYGSPSFPATKKWNKLCEERKMTFLTQNEAKVFLAVEKRKP